MKTGRIIGIIIVAIGVLTLNYLNFDDDTGFLFGLLTGLGFILIIKGKINSF